MIIVAEDGVQEFPRGAAVPLGRRLASFAEKFTRFLNQLSQLVMVFGREFLVKIFSQGIEGIPGVSARAA